MDTKGRIKLKICGITNEKDAIMVSNLGADAIGFVFAESKRKITPERAKEIIEKLPPFITTVGVFMNAEIDEVNKIAEYVSLDAVQLHGNESPKYCNKMNRKVVKGILVTKNDSKESLLKKMENYSVAAYILDPGTGSGETFDWDIATGIEKPIIIAGGLSSVSMSHQASKKNTEKKIWKKSKNSLRRSDLASYGNNRLSSKNNSISSNA
jgi:phosphoribosylanthranilate isomerase